MTPCESEAHRLIERGCSIIPVDMSLGADGKPKKSALFKWTGLQKRLPTDTEIEAWFMKAPKAGLAVISGKISNRTVIDADSPEALDLITEHLPEQVEIPTVLTPRGNGARHLIFSYASDIPTHNGYAPHLDVKNDGGYSIAPPTPGYAYAPGLSIDDCAPIEMPVSLHIFLKSLYNKIYTYKGISSRGSKEQQPATSATSATLSLSQGSRDDSIFHVAYSLLKGGMTPDNTLICLKIIAAQCTPPFPEKEMMAKFKSALKRISNKERNLTAEVRDYVSATFGIFSATNVLKAQQSQHPEDMHKIRTILSRLVKEGVIERYGNRDGQFRKVDTSQDYMNLSEITGEEFPVSLPLGLSDLCRIFPSNIIIVGGWKSAGKSAFMLNVAKQNLGKVPIEYFSSEMWTEELRGRIDKFKNVNISDWLDPKKFRAQSRIDSWADVITGEKKIFIIDYVEPSAGALYDVDNILRSIFHKLKEGIAIIGLQKPKDRDLAFGGAFTIAKSRLYLALDYDESQKCHTIKIVDAKSPKGRNPRGLVKHYQCPQGADYFSEGIWIESR